MLLKDAHLKRQTAYAEALALWQVRFLCAGFGLIGNGPRAATQETALPIDVDPSTGPLRVSLRRARGVTPGGYWIDADSDSGVEALVPAAADLTNRTDAIVYAVVDASDDGLARGRSTDIEGVSVAYPTVTLALDVDPSDIPRALALGRVVLTAGRWRLDDDYWPPLLYPTALQRPRDAVQKLRADANDIAAMVEFYLPHLDEIVRETNRVEVSSDFERDVGRDIALVFDWSASIRRSCERLALAFETAELTTERFCDVSATFLADLRDAFIGAAGVLRRLDSRSMQGVDLRLDAAAPDAGARDPQARTDALGWLRATAGRLRQPLEYRENFRERFSLLGEAVKLVKAHAEQVHRRYRDFRYWDGSLDALDLLVVQDPQQPTRLFRAIVKPAQAKPRGGGVFEFAHHFGAQALLPGSKYLLVATTQLPLPGDAHVRLTVKGDNDRPVATTPLRLLAPSGEAPVNLNAAAEFSSSVQLPGIVSEIIDASREWLAAGVYIELNPRAAQPAFERAAPQLEEYYHVALRGPKDTHNLDLKRIRTKGTDKAGTAIRLQIYQSRSVESTRARSFTCTILWRPNTLWELKLLESDINYWWDNQTQAGAWTASDAPKNLRLSTRSFNEAFAKVTFHWDASHSILGLSLTASEVNAWPLQRGA